MSTTRFVPARCCRALPVVALSALAACGGRESCAAHDRAELTAEGFQDPGPRTAAPPSDRLVGPVELPLTLDSEESRLAPAHQQLLAFFSYPYGTSPHGERDRRRRWIVRFREVEQPWLPQLRWVVADGAGGRDGFGNPVQRRRWLAIERGRVRELVIGGTRVSDTEYPTRRATSLHTCPGELFSLDVTELGAGQAAKLAGARCRDHTERLRTSFLARIRRGSAEEDALLLAARLTAILLNTKGSTVLRSDDELPRPVRWRRILESVEPPVAQDDGNLVRASGLVGPERYGSGPLAHFELEVRDESPLWEDALELTVTVVGGGVPPPED